MDIVIVVRGGNVQEVYVDRGYTDARVKVLDEDYAQYGEPEDREEYDQGMKDLVDWLANGEMERAY